MAEKFVSEITQFDDFAPDAKAVREAVVHGPFTIETGPDGGKYTGISQYPVPQWPKRIGALLGREIIPRLSCFRLNLAGELPHSWVHSDDICAKYASVLYLNRPEQCSGGTAFWEHVKLNIDRLPSRESLEAQDVDSGSFYKQMDRDWKDLHPWKQTKLVPMQWNRFITYPTCLFHSRYPFEAFGKGPEDGRLIWICFYDVAKEPK
jgi:hypothetical protein